MSAIERIRKAPNDEEAWQELERTVASEPAGDEIRDQLRSLLEGERLSTDEWESVVERSLRFCEEWLPDSPGIVLDLANRALHLRPKLEWVFERLVVLLTAAEQWGELLEAYDTVLSAVDTKDPRHAQLLDEAAQVAKDFSRDPHRAALYLRRRLALDPSDLRLASSIDRLLERNELWDELVKHLEERLDSLDGEQARTVELRIVTVLIEQLGQPARALAVLRRLTRENPGHLGGLEQLERVLAAHDAPVDIRREALDMLRKGCDAIDDSSRLVVALGMGLEFSDPAAKLSLHREMGERLSTLGRDTDAIEQYATILALSVDDVDARLRLRHLAERAERHDLRAAALCAAAEASREVAQRGSFLVEAARIHWRRLDAPEVAIELLTRVMQEPGIADHELLSVAHDLNQLLASTNASERRLQVLEQLSEIEKSPLAQRMILGEAARIAEELGDPQRAMRHWTKRLALDTPPRDGEAFDALVDINEKLEAWSELASVLVQRAAWQRSKLARREDLTRLARLQAERLDDPSAAVETWTGIAEEFGVNAEVLDAMDGLLSSIGRWDELAEFLRSSSEGVERRGAEVLTRLGDLNRTRLSDEPRACSNYAQALRNDPGHEGALAGLRALLESKDMRAAAADALAQALMKTGDWQAVVELVNVRTQAASDDRQRASLLLEAAHLCAREGGDEKSALSLVARALPFRPGDRGCEEELLRLAERTDDWTTAADALAAAADAADADSRKAELKGAEARLALTESAAGRAADAFGAATKLNPDDSKLLRGLVEADLVARRWQEAGRVFVEYVVETGSIPEDLCTRVESLANAHEGWPGLVTGLDSAFADARPHPELLRRLTKRLSTWMRGPAQNDEAALAFCLLASERSPDADELLALLSDVQLELAPHERVATLVRRDALRGRDLDQLLSAAQTAEPGEALSLWKKLWSKAGHMWSAGITALGDTQPEDATGAAREALSALYDEAGDRDATVQLLSDALAFPLPPELRLKTHRELVQRLMASEDYGRAIKHLWTIAELDPKDRDALVSLGELCAQEDKRLEAIEAYTRALGLTANGTARIELRLKVEGLLQRLEGDDERAQCLLANLEDVPGDAQSLDRLSELFEQRGRYRELADVVSQQAGRLEDGSGSARLWERAAVLSETRLDDQERAIHSYTQAVEADPSAMALDNLARLHCERHNHDQEISCLSRLLDHCEHEGRLSVLLRLARAQLAAERESHAVGSLEEAFKLAPAHDEVRTFLSESYRAQRAWRPLGEMLSTACEHLGGEKLRLCAHEAYAIWSEKLESPGEAVGPLTRALASAPDDLQLRRNMATAHRARGSLEEAAIELRAVIESYGRRRPPERAEVHLELAHVLEKGDDEGRALEELELAAKLYPGDVPLLSSLARIAQDSGQLDRAESAYRVLLANTRRRGASSTISACEVLLELGRVAETRGDGPRSMELYESALEACTNDEEATSLQARLRSTGKTSLLNRLLSARLEAASTPKERAFVLAELAEIREAEEQLEEALDFRLEAVESAPEFAELHEAAQALCRRLERLSDYEALLTRLHAVARPGTSIRVRSEILLQQGRLAEAREDLPGARLHYDAALELGFREIDVWRALARVSAAEGDTEAYERALERLAMLGGSEGETQMDALYRLAEAQLASADTLDRGVETLLRALEGEPRWRLVAKLLSRARSEHSDTSALVDLHRQAALRSEDPELLFEFLRQRVANDEASPAEIKKAAEIARELGRGDEEFDLLMKAVGNQRRATDPGGGAVWARLRLVEFELERADHVRATEWLLEASANADLAAIRLLGGRVIEKLTESDADPQLVVQLCERLLELDRSTEVFWRPLARVYRERGQIEELQALVQGCLAETNDVQARTELQLELADALAQTPEGSEAAVELLEAVLADNPSSERAQSLLMTYLSESGELDRLRGLLQEQLSHACERGDAGEAKTLALRLASAESDPVTASQALRTALSLAEDDQELLVALSSRLTIENDASELGASLEKLAAVAEDDELDDIATRAADAFVAAGDAEGPVRVLNAAYERLPASDRLRERLEAIYAERGDHAQLLSLAQDAATRQADPALRVPLILHVAEIQNEQLDDPTGACETLQEALAQNPQQLQLEFKLASIKIAMRDAESVVQRLSELLEKLDESDESRAEALHWRAKARTATGDHAGSLDDLRAGFAHAPARFGEALGEQLALAQQAAKDARDTEGEREILVQRIAVAKQLGDVDLRQELLEGWTTRQRKDAEALRMLAELLRERSDWEALIKACSRLVALENDQAQVDAALMLVRACEQVDRPGDAKRALEHARRKQPDNDELREAVRSIYEKLGSSADLGRLKLEDAKRETDPGARMAALLSAGELLLEAKDAKAAADAFGTALEMDPSNLTLGASLARVHLVAGELDEATDVLDRSIASSSVRRSPEIAVLHQLHSQVAAAKSDSDGQLEHLTKAYSCDTKNGPIAAELALLAEQHAKPLVALKALRALVALKDDSPMSLVENFARQARAYLSKGDLRGATQWIRRAKLEDEEHPMVVELAAQLEAAAQ